VCLPDMKKFFREPLVHFLLIGAGLFLLFGWRGGPVFSPAGPSGRQSARIVVTQDDIDQMTGTFARTWQRPPTEEEVERLVEDFVRNEIFYREALAIGLDRGDTVIRRRMRQKMEFIMENISDQAEPSDKELLAFMETHPDSFLLDPQIAFRQVYVNADRRGTNAMSDARKILAQLNDGVDPDTVGDPIPLDAEIELSPLWDIRRRFGEEFIRNLLDLKGGKWVGPVRSGFGLHLVFVKNRVNARMPALREVRETVKREWALARQKELKDATYKEIRERYVVTVERPKAETARAIPAAGAKAPAQ
jgi:PPIC-type PPIASE domain